MIDRCGEGVILESASFADQVILRLHATPIVEIFFWNGFTAQYTKKLTLLAAE